MRQFFISLLGSIVGFFVAIVLLFVFLAMIGSMFAMSAGKSKSPKGAVVLKLDLQRGFLDHDGGNSLFSEGDNSIVGLVRTLHRVKSDKKVKGLLIRANGYGMPPAQAEEIRAAIADFKTSGKFVIAHAQGFEGTSLSGYMAVADADEIWIPDTTSVSMAGYRAEVEFLGGVFEKFDAKPEFVQFYEYKNMANHYTQKTFTDAHREATTEMLKSIFNSAIDNISSDRDLKREQFVDFINSAPHSAEDAKAFGLIDNLGHYIEAREYAKKKAGEHTKLVDLFSYGHDNYTGPVIAFVGGQGAVVPGRSSGGNPFSNQVNMGGDTVSEAILKASKDKAVKAIIFRLNTPGGSAAASDQIWDAVERAKKAGKPVVVSMGQYAASGGYYVSANADKIVAWPTTVTGSIGVVGGKIVIADTLGKIGHNVESVSMGGDFGGAYSAFEPWNQSQREAVRASMEDIYVDFTTRVANGRKIPIEKVREIAKGRVWTGAQAKELGLVDELGGFAKALEIAKSLADIKSDEAVRIKTFPRPLTQQEKLAQLFNVSAETATNLKDLEAILQSEEYQAFLKTRAAMQKKERVRLQADMPKVK